MKSFSANIARGIRLRLKTGYLKEEPAEYLFMKRYPPVSGNRNNIIRPIEAKNIPYLKLYDKVIKRNPLFVDERVYPAYWEQDTTPLAIAKRQYDLMQQGLPEDEAFYKAKEYVEELEGKAYDEMQALTNAALSMGAHSTFATDPAVAAEIALWRERLADVSYAEMSLADQGEIDHLIHSKILGWNAVQTELRMKDPVFYAAFLELRTVVFPTIIGTADELMGTMPGKESSVEFDRNYTSSKRSNAPFYYEKYADFFGRVKENPYIGRWYTSDRNSLMEWIYKTLAIQQAVHEMQTNTMQKYMEDVRDLFFPMLRFPESASSFELPPPELLRQLLYELGIGYRSESSGLFVRRFYKLPRLLFPAETFAASCAKSLVNLRHYLRDPYLLSLVLEKDGYPASIQPLVTNRLTEIQHSVDRSHHPGGGFGGLSHGDIPEDASDEISRALEGSLFDELEDSLLSGGTHRKRVATLDAKATQSNIEDRKGYQQMAFIASLASNWRCVLADLDTPGVYEALERIVSGESSVEVIAEARAKDSPIEAHLFRMAHVVDEDAIGLASTFIDQIDKASLEDEHLAKQLRTQAIRRAFVLRAIEVFSFYHTLKDDSENSRINFPLDMPFQVLDYDHGMPLFESPDNTPLDDSPTENIATREKQFQRALREKLGALLRPVQEQPSAPVPVKDDMSAEEWNKIARKYYTPPKSKLAHMQEEWINNIQTKEGTSWERMQDLKDEDSMKFLQRKRLDLQLVVRGQLSIEFENREGARRQREFKRRGVHLNVQPYPLECQDN